LDAHSRELAEEGERLALRNREVERAFADAEEVRSDT
jgi:hypothetical protein